MRVWAVIGALVIARAASAQSAAEIATIGCRNATIKEVRTTGLGDSVRFPLGSRTGQTSNREIAVVGTGEYFDKSQGTWRRFTYDCAYRTRSAKTRISVLADSAR